MWLLSFNLNLLLLTLLVVGVCFCRRTTPAARHALWLLVLLKMLTPPLIAWPWSFPVSIHVFDTTAPQESEPPPPPDSRSEDGQHESAVAPALSLRSMEENDNPVSSSASDERSTHPVPPEPKSDWRQRTIASAAAVWLAGGLILAIVHLRRLRRFRCRLAHARPVPSRLASQVQELAARLAVRPPRLVVLPGIGSPMIWAVGRTSLLWPEGLEDELSPEGCRAVLAHELAHLARRDHWVAWLIFAAGCLWWWHPLFYLIRRRLHCEAELACDARVIDALPDARRAYAEALLDVCQRQSQTAALTPVLGIASRRRDLERRLVMIMRADVSSRLSLRMLIGIVLLGLIVLPGLTLGQGNKPNKSASTDQNKRLQELERKLQGILKDLESQRRPAPPAAVDLAFPVADNQSLPPAYSNNTLLFANQFQPPAKVYANLLAPANDQTSDRDKKLQEIEAKLQALLKEVQALRNSQSAKPWQGIVLGDVDADGIVDLLVVNDRSRGPVEITLSRTIYNLPTVKAEALGKLLQQHVKATVLETKVEGDTLTVTTTPEVQQGIRQFIALMEGKTQPPHPGQQQGK